MPAEPPNHSHSKKTKCSVCTVQCVGCRILSSIDLIDVTENCGNCGVWKDVVCTEFLSKGPPRADVEQESHPRRSLESKFSSPWLSWLSLFLLHCLFLLKVEISFHSQVDFNPFSKVCCICGLFLQFLLWFLKPPPVVAVSVQTEKSEVKFEM